MAGRLINMFFLLLAASPCVRPLRSVAATWSDGRIQSWAPQVLRSVPLVSMRASGDGRRSSRVGQVVRAELATLIRDGDVRGGKKIPDGLNGLISVVGVDMSPDLRNARVKVSVIGERKDKVSAVRWLRGNVRGLRHELAQRNRGMKRIPMLTFDHVDVGAATDMMVKLDELRREREAAARARGEDPDADPEADLDVDMSDDDVWLDDDDDDDSEEWDFDDEDDDALEAAWEAAERLGGRES